VGPFGVRVVWAEVVRVGGGFFVVRGGALFGCWGGEWRMGIFPPSVFVIFVVCSFCPRSRRATASLLGTGRLSKDASLVSTRGSAVSQLACSIFEEAHVRNLCHRHSLPPPLPQPVWYVL